jgi:hypothetical protein
MSHSPPSRIEWWHARQLQAVARRLMESSVAYVNVPPLLLPAHIEETIRARSARRRTPQNATPLQRAVDGSPPIVAGWISMSACLSGLGGAVSPVSL